jgi:hypothetical protein
MTNIYLTLSVLWICTMLTYLLGDVLRIFAGDFKPGEISGVKVAKKVYLGIAVFMVIPIIMVFLSITLQDNINRIVNIIIAGIFFIFNLLALPSYQAYDKFLLIVSLVFNALTIWYAWNWNI